MDRTISKTNLVIHRISDSSDIPIRLSTLSFVVAADQLDMCGSQRSQANTTGGTCRL